MQYTLCIPDNQCILKIPFVRLFFVNTLFDNHLYYFVYCTTYYHFSVTEYLDHLFLEMIAVTNILVYLSFCVFDYKVQVQ